MSVASPEHEASWQKEGLELQRPLLWLQPSRFSMGIAVRKGRKWLLVGRWSDVRLKLRGRAPGAD